MGALPFIVLAIVTGLAVASHKENDTSSFDIRITLARIPKTQTYYVCQQFQVSTSKRERGGGRERACVKCLFCANIRTAYGFVSALNFVIHFIFKKMNT